MTLAQRTLHLSGDVCCGMRSMLRLATVVFLLVVLASCSTRFIYNQLDSLIIWKLGGFVTLTKSQKDELKTRITGQLEIVRQEDLPQIATVLDRAATDVAAGQITPESVDQGYQDMIALFDRFMLGIIPVSEWFFLSLSDEQVAELFVNLEELNNEMYEDYSGRTAEERRENRDRSAVKGVQRFTGKLRDDQKELISGALASMEDASEQWIDYQRDWQQRFKDLIKNPPESDQFRSELTTLFVYPRSFHTADYRAIVDRNRQIFNEMVAELINGLSDKQRNRLVDKLQGYVELLNDLAEDD